MNLRKQEIKYLWTPCIYIYIYIYTPWQKYKTTLKNEEKDIVYNF